MARSEDRYYTMLFDEVANSSESGAFNLSNSIFDVRISYLNYTDPDLKLYGAGIPVVSEFKFLGLIFDKKFTFNKHIEYLKDRCMKALNLLRVCFCIFLVGYTQTPEPVIPPGRLAQIDLSCVDVP